MRGYKTKANEREKKYDQIRWGFFSSAHPAILIQAFCGCILSAKMFVYYHETFFFLQLICVCVCPKYVFQSLYRVWMYVIEAILGAERNTKQKWRSRFQEHKKAPSLFFFLALLACLQYVHVRLNLALFFVFRWIFSLFFGYFFWMCVWELFKSHLDFECLGWHSWFNIVFFFFIRSTIDITLFI